MEYQYLDTDGQKSIRAQLLAQAEADHYQLVCGLQTLRAVTADPDEDPQVNAASQQLDFLERKIEALRDLGDPDAQVSNLIAIADDTEPDAG